MLRMDLPAHVDTLMEVLRWRADSSPEAVAFTFLEDGEAAEATLTLAALQQRAEALAALLIDERLRGERVALVFPSGLDFIAALFGCFLAGAVAVPAAPPTGLPRDTGRARLSAILQDCRAAAVVTATTRDAELLRDMVPAGRNVRWLASAMVAAAGRFRAADVSADHLAMLQYTSGSTAEPKGVMITHRNLMANADVMQRSLNITPRDRAVFWLPLYHDYGLVSGILQPVYSGATSVLMSPLHFLQRPVRWLRAVSRFRATHSGAPNFAFELCTRSIGDEDKATLDLSCWYAASTGGEPVRATTLQRFAAAFATCGFDARAFYPSYGLAEATLLASGVAPRAGCRVLTVDAAALRANRPVPASTGLPLASCGHTPAPLQICIVDPTTRRPCAAGDVGEIWLRGPSVAPGYWNRPLETAQTFEARLVVDATEPAGDDDAGWLRTGDLGFQNEGDLFVTGRIKDLIILDGANHYPQDIEATVQQCDHRLRPGCTVAFAVDDGEAERLVIVAEVRDGATDFETLPAVIRAAVSRDHGIPVHAVRLLAPGTVPKTSSGKLRRLATRAAYLAGAR